MKGAERDLTTLLVDWSKGDQGALDELIPLVQPELQRLARSYLRRERVGHILQTDALINEAYIRLVDQNRVEWASRAHFFGICARMMRRILVDYARKEKAGKRGGGLPRVTLDEGVAASPPRRSTSSPCTRRSTSSPSSTRVRPRLSSCAALPALRSRRPPRRSVFLRRRSNASGPPPRPGCTARSRAAASRAPASPRCPRGGRPSCLSHFPGACRAVK